jgi:hypothetical protein
MAAELVTDVAVVASRAACQCWQLLMCFLVNNLLLPDSGAVFLACC